MRRISVYVLVCLLLTACKVGIVKRGDLTPSPPVTATLTALPAETLPPTSTSDVAPTGTSQPARTPDTTPTETTQPSPTPAALPATQPAPSPTPLSTASPEPEPVILDFTATPVEISPGSPVTLTWSSTGGVQASLRMDTPTVHGFQSVVPPNGSLVVDTKDTDRHWQKYQLLVSNNAGVSAEAFLTVRFYCPYDFFFTIESELCPDGPAQSSWAAEQTFEGGRMIWLQDENGEKRIYAFYANQRCSSFLDTWTPEEAQDDPGLTPPEGKYQPIRGFGQVWRNEPQVREQLGWALGPEQGFDTLYQDVSGFEWNNACHYLRTLNGRVIGLCRRGHGSWFYATP